MASKDPDSDGASGGKTTAKPIWISGSESTEDSAKETTPLLMPQKVSNDATDNGASGDGDGGGYDDGVGSNPVDGAEGEGVRGLSVMQTALLIAGEMAGSGVLALPRALAKMGWVGLPVIILMCGIAAFGGSRLGACWALLEARHPALRRRQRSPYALIAQHTLGRRGRVLVSVCIQVTLVGAGVVYLLLAAQIVSEVLRAVFPSVGVCMWLLYIALILTPALWLGSPKDFSFIGTLASGSTALACLFYFVQIMNDVKPYKVYRYGLHGFEDFFLAFGTILFSFGGASTFPTIQNDMVEKQKFSKSIVIAFAAILLLYLPLTIAAYVVYGEAVAPNMASSLTPTTLTMMGNVLMAVHLIFAFIIFLNPVFQEWEEKFNVPHEFGWRRVALRSCLMLGMLLLGATVPRFSALLALVGGSTVALLTYILPTYCYMRLVQQTPLPPEPRSTPIYMKVVFWEIIAVGAVGGLAATYSAFSTIFSNQMVRPCYLR